MGDREHGDPGGARTQAGRPSRQTTPPQGEDKPSPYYATKRLAWPVLRWDGVVARFSSIVGAMACPRPAAGRPPHLQSLYHSHYLLLSHELESIR
ncbi:MAG TPA: hypothetical protein VF844_05265 [Ktedonobacteraceae bacterium]